MPDTLGVLRCLFLVREKGTSWCHPTALLRTPVEPCMPDGAPAVVARTDSSSARWWCAACLVPSVPSSLACFLCGWLHPLSEPDSIQRSLRASLAPVFAARPLSRQLERIAVEVKVVAVLVEHAHQTVVVIIQFF